jgi:hypothetical protein
MSPIALFCYNRPENTRNVLNSLSKNSLASDSEIYIFCDGPKHSNGQIDIENIALVHKIVQREDRFRKVHIFINQENRGLANSIISGINVVLNFHPTVIVVEDDLILSKYFLQYMNISLSLYENNKQVFQIGSCNFFACGPSFPTFFFIPIPETLGWGTWKDRWEMFEPDAEKLRILLQNDLNALHRFNGFGSYNFSGMLEDQINKTVDSWAIRWQAVIAINKGLVLYHNYSLSQHIASKTATHANINIKPPLVKKAMKFYTIDNEEIPHVIDAMKLGYSGLGDFYGDLKIKKDDNIFLIRIIKKIKSKLQSIKKIVSEYIY